MDILKTKLVKQPSFFSRYKKDLVLLLIMLILILAVILMTERIIQKMEEDSGQLHQWSLPEKRDAH